MTTDQIIKAGGIDNDLARPVVESTEDVTDADSMHDVGRLMEYLSVSPWAIAVAAPQLGIRRRLYVVRERNGHPHPTGTDYAAYHNPELTPLTTRTHTERESCLSFNRDYFVPRFVRVRVAAEDVLGIKVLANHQGYDARVHQHEIDHLDGILISDRGRRAP